MQETWVPFLGQKDPLEREMATHFSILAGKFHRQRSLVAYSSKGSQESDTTEQLNLPTYGYSLVFAPCSFLYV